MVTSPEMREASVICFTIVLVLGTGIVQADLISDFMQVFNKIEQQYLLSQVRPDKDGSANLDPLDVFFSDIFPKMIDQESNNVNGTKSEFIDFAIHDDSNDDAYLMSQQELIVRSGFKYEYYDSVSDDGYITGLTRLINPKADHKKLLYPPVILEHGGTIDPTAYLIANSIQHHPEKWPRSPRDGPITSWNRSLAFTLANNGFDVWLAETRGANDKERRRLKGFSFLSVLSGENDFKNLSIGESFDELLRNWEYWSFSQDDLIAHELKGHMDTVMEITSAKKVHLFTFSLSTPSSLAFLATRPDYAQKIAGYVSMAPIISGQGTSQMIKFFFQFLCPSIPSRLGTLIFTDMVLSEPIRAILVLATRSKILRFTLVKWVTTLLFGPSAKYQTHLEINIMGHMLRHLGYKELKQMCQQSKANKLQKFDYGPVKNMLVYKSKDPPVYDISNMKIKDWIMISAANDELATLEMAEHMKKLVNPKPSAHIVVPGYNHLDLIAAFENDKYVNLPILSYFNKMSERPPSDFGEASIDSHGDLAAAGARALDFKTFLPKELAENLENGTLKEAADFLTESVNKAFATDNLVEKVQKGIEDFLSGLPKNPLVQKSEDKKP